MSVQKMGRTPFIIEYEDDRMYVPCGDLDIAIVLADDGTGIIVDVYPQAVVDEPLKTICIFFDDVKGSDPDFKFTGFDGKETTYNGDTEYLFESIMVVINGLVIDIMNIENSADHLTGMKPGAWIIIRDDEDVFVKWEIPYGIEI